MDRKDPRQKEEGRRSRAEELLRPLTRAEYDALPPIDPAELEEALRFALERRKEFERRTRPPFRNGRHIFYRNAA